ncbi:MAG: sodium:proton antiporter [Gammaproteobacteria bacterium]|nr:sodium:proton antiporter [Gammaproteobacteria bacterium]MCH9743888.1 sodium:proton antiporter [Gammaproteobacteria bacterium]
MTETVTLTLTGIALLTLVCQWFAWWVKLPAILFLLICGIIIGPELGWLNPHEIFGHLLTPIIQLSVAIILFEGSLTLNFESTGNILKIVRRLVTIGTLITTVVTAFFAHWLFHLPFVIAVLFGAIVSVTGPTVIVPILRTVRPSLRVANILRWEGIIIDPIGAIFAVLILTFITATQTSIDATHIILHFGEMIVVAAVLGIVTGYWLGVALRNHWIPEFLHNVATLSLVILVFTISNRVDEGSGLVAVTLMGVLLSNMKNVHIEDILGFKESLSILLISGLFIILAAQVNLTELHNVLWTALILVAAIQFIVRPLNVFTCTIGSDLNWRERFLIAWIAPRGIVAAAIAALFAIHLKQLAIGSYQLLTILTFMVIIGTVIFQSLTSRFVAQILKVSEPEPRGFLIIGANPVARTIAKALLNQKFRVLLAAAHWESVSTARMEGLNTYYGNPISDHADRNLDLIGIGRMLGLTPQSDMNTLAAMRYRREFGNNNIFTLQTQEHETKAPTNKHQIATRHRGKILFGKNITYARLASWIAQGAKISATTLTENFDFKSFQVTRGNNAIPLFAISPRDNLHLFTEDKIPKLGDGWTLVSLIK